MPIQMVATIIINRAAKQKEKWGENAAFQKKGRKNGRGGEAGAGKNRGDKEGGQCENEVKCNGIH